VSTSGASVARRGGLVVEELHVDRPFVATLQPGVRGVEPPDATKPSGQLVRLDLVARRFAGESPGHDAQVLEVLPPDVATLDLAEAHRIVGGGAGLDSEERFAQLQAIATALGASLGATRVVTDRHWLPHDRQIGTTGVVVDPALYVAFGISGAVQHTSGLGQPDHIISVNTDAFCPMMQLADLAIVADANAVLDELAERLGIGLGLTPDIAHA
jgi:electron transfer flavoprotein alpha subunit